MRHIRDAFVLSIFLFKIFIFQLLLSGGQKFERLAQIDVEAAEAVITHK